MSRCLREIELCGKVNVKKPFASLKKNQRTRMSFAKELRIWSNENWKKELFSNKSKFNLFVSEGRHYKEYIQARQALAKKSLLKWPV